VPAADATELHRLTTGYGRVQRAQPAWKSVGDAGSLGPYVAGHPSGSTGSLDQHLDVAGFGHRFD
jgi:hypothetical protein